MKNPAISICIPTYNRASLLEVGLKSIISQFKTPSIYQRVEIIISDDNSPDNTAEMIKNYAKKYKNISYYKNKKNIKSDANIIKSATYAKGNYIWFFGDDDIHNPWSLKTLLAVIDKFHPDAIICNLDLSSKDGSRILDRNMINLKGDALIKTKKELFSFLESKFFMPLDWYITCMSNTIVSRKLFKDNVETVMKFYDPKSNNFLHSGLIFYNTADYKIYIISKSLAIYRGYNISFGPDENTQKSKYLTFLYRILKKHNDLIYKINKENMSIKFILLLFLKNLTREIRLKAVKYFNYDISGALIKLFHKKEV